MLSPLWFIFALTLFTNGSRTKDDPFGDDADDHFEGNGLNLVSLVETDDDDNEDDDEDDQVAAQKPTSTAPEQRIVLSGKAEATRLTATINLTESGSPFTTPMTQNPSLKPGSSAELTQHVVNGIIDMGEEQTGYVQAGTPQGCILSPFLFIIYTNDLPIQDDGSIEFSQYADDTALWCRDRCPKLAERRLQGGLDQIQRWCSKWRLKLSPTKSTVVNFMKRPTLNEIPPYVSLFGNRIPVKSSVTFLGVIFNEKMSWTEYIEGQLKKCTYRIHLINRLARRTKNGDYTTVFQLFNSLVTSLFEFAAPIFLNMPELLWRKIDKMQMRAIKSFLNIPTYISEEITLDASGQERLNKTIRERSRKRLLSICRTSPMLVDTICRSAFSDSIYQSPLDILTKHNNVRLGNICGLCALGVLHHCVPGHP